MPIDFKSVLPESYEKEDIRQGLVSLMDYVLKQGIITDQVTLDSLARLRAKTAIELS